MSTLHSQFVNNVQNPCVQNVHIFERLMMIYKLNACIIVNIHRARMRGGEEMSAYKYPNIEAERSRSGLSQEEFISRLGYKERRTYYLWLSKGNIPTDALIKMSDMFDCSVDYLLGRTRISTRTHSGTRWQVCFA